MADKNKTARTLKLPPRSFEDHRRSEKHIDALEGNVVKRLNKPVSDDPERIKAWEQEVKAAKKTQVKWVASIKGALSGAIEEGWNPALGNREMLGAPIFANSAKMGGKHNSKSRIYRRDPYNGNRGIFYETSNPLPSITGKDAKGNDLGRENEGGLLTYFDQDVFVTLLNNWTLTGNRSVEYASDELYKRLGYLTGYCPRTELKASITRMVNTRVSFGHTDMHKRSEVQSFHLIDTPNGGTSIATGRGHKMIVNALLAESYIETLHNSNWQVFDSKLYEKMCCKNRDMGLARSMYLFLCSLRKGTENSFEFKKGWLVERFQDHSWDKEKPRKDGGKGDWRISRSRDPWNQKSIFRKNWDFLVSCGAIQIDRFESSQPNVEHHYDDWITGFFIPDLKNISYYDGQKYLLEHHIDTGEARLIEENTYIEFDQESDSEAVSAQALAEVKAQLAKTVRQANKPSAQALEEATVYKMAEAIAYRRDKMQHAFSSGWTVEQLLNVMIEGQEKAKSGSLIKNIQAFMGDELKLVESDRQKYTNAVYGSTAEMKGKHELLLHKVYEKYATPEILAERKAKEPVKFLLLTIFSALEKRGDSILFGKKMAKDVYAKLKREVKDGYYDQKVLDTSFPGNTNTPALVEEWLASGKSKVETLLKACCADLFGQTVGEFMKEQWPAKFK